MNTLRKHLKPGKVYRRSHLTKLSTSIDRHLQELTKTQELQKIAYGIYYCPIKRSFGNVPPKDSDIIKTFLKSNDFLLFSLNAYNLLDLGTTQLYNKCVVYNHKRHGRIKLGGKIFHFHLKHKFPKKISKEFLLIDLLNNLHELPEDYNTILNKIKQKVFKNLGTMRKFLDLYSTERTKNIIGQWYLEWKPSYA